MALSLSGDNPRGLSRGCEGVLGGPQDRLEVAAPCVTRIALSFSRASRRVFTWGSPGQLSAFECIGEVRRPLVIAGECAVIARS